MSERRYFQEGDFVVARSAFGEIEAVIVKILGPVVVLGSHDEYVATRKFGLGRFAIGFQMHDILRKVNPLGR